MFNPDFTTLEDLRELGETVCCVYFYKIYPVNKAIQYMRWRGFSIAHMYTCEGYLIFYQAPEFVPILSVEDQFRREVNASNIWERFPNPIKNDIRTRDVSDGVICLSFIGCE